MTKVTAITMALLAVLLAGPSADAASTAQQNLQNAQKIQTVQQMQTIQNMMRTQQAGANPQQVPARSVTEFQSQTLTQMVELPEVPQYTGQMTFATGTCFPNAKSGASYTLKLHSLEFKQSVKDWYQLALEQTGWKIEKAMCNENTVAAWKGKQLVQIIVAPPSHNRFRSDVLIRYRSGT